MAPKIVIVRKEIYDPSLERYVNEELPTVTVTKARKVNTMSANAALASHYVGSGTAATGAGTVGMGTVGRLHYLNIYTTSAPLSFYMKDRNGTIGFHNFIAAGEKTLFGDALKTFRVIEGSFSINTLASVAAGTYTIDFAVTKRSVKV